MATKKSELNLPFFVEKILARYWLGTGSVMVRSWFGDLGHGSGFGSAEPKFSGSVVHYLKTYQFMEFALLPKWYNWSFCEFSGWIQSWSIWMTAGPLSDLPEPFSF